MWVLNMLCLSSTHINDSNQSLKGIKEPLNDSENPRVKNKTNLKAIKMQRRETISGEDWNCQKKFHFSLEIKGSYVYSAQVLSFWTIRKTCPEPKIYDPLSTRRPHWSLLTIVK